jgi:hypothetical protein
MWAGSIHDELLLGPRIASDNIHGLGVVQRRAVDEVHHEPRDPLIAADPDVRDVRIHLSSWLDLTGVSG